MDPRWRSHGAYLDGRHQRRAPSPGSSALAEWPPSPGCSPLAGYSPLAECSLLAGCSPLPGSSALAGTAGPAAPRERLPDTPAAAAPPLHETKISRYQHKDDFSSTPDEWKYRAQTYAGGCAGGCSSEQRSDPAGS